MSEQRKTVTVLFCDLAGSTALGESVDPERLRGLLARYFEQMKGIVESHGGTVEKFIGDAVMAVFGVPVTHEDDALRAVRAAAEMRDALPALGLEGRIGVMTGEVITGTEERLVTGDAVNVAARLEQAAKPGEVLVGEPTLALVRDAVDVEPVEPLTLKGKAEPVAAHRLTAVHDAPERSHDMPFVGREYELALLHAAWQRVVGERRCELVTIVGEAGVGKSRLVAEFTASIETRHVYGRCLSYGEGITYWPVVEILKQLDSRPDDDAAAATIEALLGDSDAQTTADDIAWSFRKTLEHAATERPLVVVFDDIQWGEQTFRDLIEHVALLSTNAPILLVCLARPELVEQHPGWHVTLRLEPLAADAVDRLISDAISDDLRGRIALAAGGNPLFIGEMLAISAAAESDVVVPPTLQALLAARLDQLDPAERAVLERGAVEGETFHRGAVQALAADDTPVIPRLAALVRKQLVRPDKPQIAGDDGFSFRHLLLRDAAYEALPKARRAELHERLADWLEQHGTDLVELDELLGYHLEQAWAYSIDLGLDGDRTRDLSLRAGRLLGAAGRRAHVRGDDGAVRSLLGRATRLRPANDPELPLLLAMLGSSLYEGGDAQGALEALRQAQEAAGVTGQRVAALRSRMDELAITVRVEPGTVADALAEVETAIEELERADDAEALGRAWRALIEIGFVQEDYELVGRASEQLLGCARRTGIRREEVWAVRGVAAGLAYGPAPVDEAIPRVEGALAEFSRERAGEDHLALLYAYAGRFEDADRAMERSRNIRLELGQTLDHAGLAVDDAFIALLAGHPDRAEPVLEAAAKVFERAGESDYAAGIQGLMAEVLYALGRYEDAEHRTRLSEQAFPAGTAWHATRAKLLARRGATDEALRLSAAAVEHLRRSNSPHFLGDALCDRAEVLTLLGRPSEAIPLLEEALGLFERKGIVPLVERTRERLADLRAAAS